MKWCIVFTLWILHLRLSAQEVHPLEVGDVVPPSTVIFWEKGEIGEDVLDFSNDDLVILSFWAAWCTSCIESISSLDSLQKEFKGKIKVWLVNSSSTMDKINAVSHYLLRWNKSMNGNFSLRSIIEDRYFEQLFPHHSVPHYVWILRGRFMAISDKESVSRSTIERMISDGEYVGRKKSRSIKSKVDDPLLSIVSKLDSDFTYSVFTGFGEGIGGIINRSLRPFPHYSTFTFLNQTLLAIIKIATNFRFSDNQVELIWKDEIDSSLTSLLDSLVCYERHDVVRSRREMYSRIQKDIENQFSLRISVVEKEKYCLVIEQFPVCDQAGSSSENCIQADRFLHLINEISKLPVFFATTDDLLKYVRLRGPLPTRYEELIKFLESQGFVLTGEMRRQKVLQVQSI